MNITMETVLRLIEPLIEGDAHTHAMLMRVLTLNLSVSRGFCTAVEKFIGLNSKNVQDLITKYETIRIRSLAFEKHIDAAQNSAKELYLSCDLLYKEALNFTGADESIMVRLEEYYPNILALEQRLSYILALKGDPCGERTQAITDMEMHNMVERLISDLADLSAETRTLIQLLEQSP